MKNLLLITLIYFISSCNAQLGMNLGNSFSSGRRGLLIPNLQINYRFVTKSNYVVEPSIMGSYVVFRQPYTGLPTEKYIDFMNSLVKFDTSYYASLGDVIKGVYYRDNLYLSTGTKIGKKIGGLELYMPLFFGACRSFESIFVGAPKQNWNLLMISGFGFKGANEKRVNFFAELLIDYRKGRVKEQDIQVRYDYGYEDGEFLLESIEYYTEPYSWSRDFRRNVLRFNFGISIKLYSSLGRQLK